MRGLAGQSLIFFGTTSMGLIKNKKTYKNKVIFFAGLRAVYVPIPKVASSSVKHHFADVLYPDRAGTFSGKIHQSEIFEYRLKESVDFSEYKDYFKFSFVRNPWDRIVSCYVDKILNRSERELFMKKRDTLFLEYPWYRPGMTFDEFVRGVSKTPDSIADEHFRSQTSFIVDSNFRPFVDFVGKYENIQNDFLRVCQSLQIPGISLRHTNKTKKGHYSSYYSEETRDIVARRYEDDIRMFGYSFEKAE